MLLGSFSTAAELKLAQRLSTQFAGLRGQWIDSQRDSIGCLPLAVTPLLHLQLDYNSEWIVFILSGNVARMDDDCKTAEPKIISEIDMLYHEEFLCLSKLSNGQWLLDIRIYDFVDRESHEFVDSETGEVEIPDQIDGLAVKGVDEAMGEVILVDRLIPHLDDDIAKLRYQFTDFDWREFKKTFGDQYDYLCEDSIKNDIEAAVSHSG